MTLKFLGGKTENRPTTQAESGAANVIRIIIISQNHLKSPLESHSGAKLLTGHQLSPAMYYIISIQHKIQFIISILIV